MLCEVRGKYVLLHGGDASCWAVARKFEVSSVRPSLRRDREGCVESVGRVLRAGLLIRRAELWRPRSLVTFWEAPSLRAGSRVIRGGSFLPRLSSSGPVSDLFGGATCHGCRSPAAMSSGSKRNISMARISIGSRSTWKLRSMHCSRWAFRASWCSSEDTCYAEGSGRFGPRRYTS